MNTTVAEMPGCLVKRDTEGGSMDWLELIWNIASMWALCVGCLMIFVAVLRRRGEADVVEKQNKKAGVAPPHGI